jgi:peptide-methionine (R)-S-oxide reductase
MVTNARLPANETDMDMNRRTLIGGAGAGLLGSILLLRGANGARAAQARFEVRYTDAEWRRRLTPQQYSVLRQAATERAGSSPLDHEKRAGTFVCAGCGLPLYSSRAKYDSGTGWPSFVRPLPNAVRTHEDNSLFFKRVEVLCRRCGGHLGHVFDDGPPPTGLRYCMNGAAMKFVPWRGA